VRLFFLFNLFLLSVLVIILFFLRTFIPELIL